MKASKVDQYPGYPPPRKRGKGPLIAFLIVAFGLICFVFLVPVVMVAMVLARVLDGAFSNLTVSILPFLISLIAPLAELLWLLVIGEYVQFGVRLLEAIFALNPR